MRNEKESWNFRSVLAFIILITLVMIVVKVGISEYRPAMAKQYEMQLVEQQQMNAEIDEAFKAQNKLQITQTELDTIKAKHKAIIESKKARTILDLSKTNKPRYIVEVMFRLWEREGGIYDYVPYCIAAYESNFYTFTHNQNGEDSRGLFQVNVPFHPRANPIKLFEPVYNMKYQFQELVQFEKKGISMGLTGINLALYVARYGQRPNWEKCSGYITSTITKTYNEFQNIKLN